MRAVLEKSIKAFAEARGADIRASGNNQSGYVQLSHALKWLLDYVTKNGPKDLIQPIKRVRSGTLTTMAEKDTLNAVNHNHKFLVAPSEAFHLWDSIDPIVRYLMAP